jgi:hypothetical protein
MKSIITASMCIALTSLTGCASFNTVKYERHVTVGQELLDLKKAKISGVITDAEYTKQVQGLLKSQSKESKVQSALQKGDE